LGRTSTEFMWKWIQYDTFSHSKHSIGWEGGSQRTRRGRGVNHSTSLSKCILKWCVCAQHYDIFSSLRFPFCLLF
jgi:hypothetical protein